MGMNCKKITSSIVLFKERNTRITARCDLETTHICVFVIRKNKKRNRVQSIKSYQKARKIMKRLKINGCAICGYNECNEALEFHHTNPKDKSFCIINASFKRTDTNIARELDKCILLCANCHRKIHKEERLYNEV